MKQDGVNFLPLSLFQKPFPNTIIIFIVSIIGRQWSWLWPFYIMMIKHTSPVFLQRMSFKHFQLQHLWKVTHSLISPKLSRSKSPELLHLVFRFTRKRVARFPDSASDQLHVLQRFICAGNLWTHRFHRLLLGIWKKCCTMRFTQLVDGISCILLIVHHSTISIAFDGFECFLWHRMDQTNMRWSIC